MADRGFLISGILNYMGEQIKLKAYIFIQITDITCQAYISLEMPVPGQGHNGLHSYSSYSLLILSVFGRWALRS